MNEFSSGLSKQEQAVMQHLVTSWNMFVMLDDNSADDLRAFRDSVHVIQGILAARAMGRNFPMYWNSAVEKEN